MNFIFTILVRLCIAATGALRFMNGFKTIMVDFDGVLFPTGEKLFNTDFKSTRPPEVMREYIAWLYFKGFRVLIFTTRAIYHPTSYFKMKKYLKEHGIKHDYITPVKFPAIMYIDDAAFWFDADEHDPKIKHVDLLVLKESTLKFHEETAAKRKRQWGF